MKCPTDSTTLQITERQGIEIDYCPDCRGVWLDRGELEKIIDRAAAPVEVPSRGRREDRYDDDFDDDRVERDGHRGKRRRSSFLGDLFDIG